MSLLSAALATAPQTPKAGLTGVVFDDRNRDGVRQSGEPGLGNVVVSNQIDVALTAADGTWALPAVGTGVVFVTAPRGRAAVGRFWREVPGPPGTALEFPLAEVADPDDFTFLHASDTHVSEESLPRTRGLLEMIRTRRPDLVLVSGDLIRDALRVGEAEATRLFELYARETAGSPAPVWNVPGNHEIFGIERHHSLVSSAHPLFGRKMYRKHLGPDYYSFNRGRIHFIALNSVDISDLWYHGNIDPAQLAWLEKDLSLVPRETTVVTFNHIPFFSAANSVNGFTDQGVAPSTIRIGDKTVYRHVVANAGEVIRRLEGHRHTLALAGHNHAFERLSLSPDPAGTRFHLAAAVIGPRTGLMPSPSGATLYRVSGDAIDDGEFVPLVPAPAR